ncbi:MAG: ribosome-associated translation inhibitor RaiA [bacterium]|nr:ribosome-associated translation inhibitor RaiA [bacterium]
MIAKMEVTGINYDVSDDLQKYIEKKLGRMDRFIPKNARESAHMEVKLKEGNSKNKNKQYSCEVVLFLPKNAIRIEDEPTINMFAAVDIVETMLKNRLKKYKEKHTKKSVSRKLITKLRSKSI